MVSKWLRKVGASVRYGNEKIHWVLIPRVGHVNQLIAAVRHGQIAYDDVASLKMLKKFHSSRRCYIFRL